MCIELVCLKETDALMQPVWYELSVHGTKELYNDFSVYIEKYFVSEK